MYNIASDRNKMMPYGVSICSQTRYKRWTWHHPLKDEMRVFITFSKKSDLPNFSALRITLLIRFLRASIRRNGNLKLQKKLKRALWLQKRLWLLICHFSVLRRISGSKLYPLFLSTMYNTITTSTLTIRWTLWKKTEIDTKGIAVKGSQKPLQIPINSYISGW